MARRVVLPVNDAEFLFWLSTRMVHVYRLSKKDPTLDRVVAIAQNLPWNQRTTVINDMTDAGWITSNLDREFLHALARHLVEKFKESPRSDIVIRLRAIANATPLTQMST